MKADGFKSILVDCVGPPDGDTRERCWHSSAVKLDDLPDWKWPNISGALEVYEVRERRLGRFASQLGRGHQLRQRPLRTIDSRIIEQTR
jgi:hypothetical protein